MLGIFCLFNCYVTPCAFHQIATRGVSIEEGGTWQLCKHTHPTIRLKDWLVLSFSHTLRKGRSATILSVVLRNTSCRPYSLSHWGSTSLGKSCSAWRVKFGSPIPRNNEINFFHHGCKWRRPIPCAVKTSGFCEVVKNTFREEFCKSDFLYIFISAKRDWVGVGVSKEF